MPHESPNMPLDEPALLVLALLADGPRWGYAIGRRLEDTAGLKLGWGRLYPLLHRVEAAGLVAVRQAPAGGRVRKWYELTDAGHTALRRAAAEWSARIARKQALVLPAVRRSASRRQRATGPISSPP